MRGGFLPFLALALALTMVALPSLNASLTLPNDPMLKQQWGWFDIYADRAYNSTFHGANITVAVLDTGVDANHLDLKANLLPGWNFVDGNNNVTDTDGHGTMTTGIIAAIANNTLGIAGTAPQVKILPLKVLSTQGGSYIAVDQAILYAQSHHARIISMSFGGQPGRFGSLVETAIQNAYAAGIVLVAAAGNSNSSAPFYPAAYPQVIAVAAVNPYNQKSSYSNYGNYIELAAPGDSILSTLLGNRYAFGSGTSFAAPFVSGVVALMLSKNSTMTPDQVRSALNSEAIHLGTPGWNQYYGYGLVNACAAVASNCPTTPGWTKGPLTLTPVDVAYAMLALTLAIPVANRLRARQQNQPVCRCRVRWLSL